MILQNDTRMAATSFSTRYYPVSWTSMMSAVIADTISASSGVRESSLGSDRPPFASPRRSAARRSKPSLAVAQSNTPKTRRSAFEREPASTREPTPSVLWPTVCRGGPWRARLWVPPVGGVESNVLVHLRGEFGKRV